MVGYTLPLIKGKDLTKIDPFMVSLSNLYNLVNDVYKDIKLLTEIMWCYTMFHII